MGCSNSKGDSFDLYDAVTQAGLQQPWSNKYENQFEKDLFMAMNLFRYVPSKWIGFVKDLKRLFPKEFGKDDAPLVDHVCKILSTFKPMGQIKFDDNANKAVRQNNTEVIALNEDEPTVGGNETAFRKMVEGDGKMVDATEFTVYNWSQSAMHLVAYQLLKHYKAEKAAEKSEDKDSKVETLHPLMDGSLASVGISFKGHKKVENLIQVLFLKDAPNALE